MPNELRYKASLNDNVSGPLERIRDKFEMVKKQGVKGFGLGVGAAVATAGINAISRSADAMVGFVSDSVRAASDLSETVSKARVIFGEGSDEIEKWGDTAAKAFGQSKRQALDTAAGFAGLFQTVGLAAEQATTYATELTELGSDLASFFNTDVQTAIDSLKSGLSGETEPLRKFNVFLSETAVSAKLAEMGIKRVGGQFTEAQKATARYTLIMEQTKTAQGDFARTSDGLANTQRTLQAQMEEVQVAIGEELLPVLVDLGNWLKDDGVPAFKALVETLKLLGSAFGEPTDEVIEFRKQAQETGIFWQITGQKLVETTQDVGDAGKNMSGGFVSSSREMKRGMDVVQREASSSRTRITRLSDKVKDLSDNFRDLKKWATDAGDAIAESSYGPRELELAFEGARLELIDNQRELRDTMDEIQTLRDKGKPVPLELKRRFNDLQQSVIEGKQEVIRLGTRLGALDNSKLKDIRAEFDRLKVKIGSTGDAAWDLLQLLKDIDREESQVNWRGSNQMGGIGGRAAGGPVLPGETYMVNENGTEYLHMGSQSGVISTGAGRAGQGGGGGSLTINVSTPVLTPGGAQALADAIAPAITRWQQMRGV